MKLPTLTTSLLIAGLTLGSTAVMANDYVIDTKGAHASIKFRVQHLGYSWLYGQFNEFSGKFSYDEKQPEKASAEVTIKTGSVDSNHAERDKHLRSDDFLQVDSRVLTENFNDLCQILDIVKSGDSEAARQVAMRHVQRFSEYMESTEKGWAADMARERSA